MPVDLVLENVRALTLDPKLPIADFVALEGDRIAGLGSSSETRRLATGGARRIDCQGMTLVPGFNDAHCHLLAFASSLIGVDCRPDQVRSIAEIIETIQERAPGTPPGRYIRAYGYDEFYLKEGRHPTRWDLDTATTAHPVRLDHRTGHASVLNSAALSLLGIDHHTPDPVDAVIERDEGTGEPTGLLFEMGKHLRPLGQTACIGQELMTGIRKANRILLSRGITSIQDATPTNDPTRWRLFQKLKQDGYLTTRASLMVGAPHLQDFLQEGLAPSEGDSQMRLGAVKIVLSLVTGMLQPSREELVSLVTHAHRSGYQVAIHAVEHEAVEAAASTLVQVQEAWPRPRARHRIEHCCECPAELIKMVADSQSMVVAQPAFTHLYGDKYLSQTPGELVPHLYPFRRMGDAGVTLAAGSDAPVGWPDPLLSIYAATTRRMANGQSFNEAQRLSAFEALRMHTWGGAYASFEEANKGTIEVSKLADLVLLTDDPTSVDVEAIKDIGVAITIVGGQVAWET